MADFSVYLLIKKIQPLNINVFQFSAFLTGKMAVILFAVGVEGFSIALEGVDLSIFS